MSAPTAAAPPPEPTKPFVDSGESDDYAWTDRAFELLSAGVLTAAVTTSRDGHVITGRVAGPCPRCFCPMVWNDVLSAVADGVTGTLHSSNPGTDRWFPLPADCRCTSSLHAGGPQGTRGCGATFVIDVRQDGT